MTVGLQIFNGDGSLLVEFTDKLSRFHGTATVNSTTSQPNGSVSVPGIADDGTWALFVLPNNTEGAPNIETRINNGSFTWQRSVFAPNQTLTETVWIFRT